ncbi:MAG: polysaccharide deacetylase family protein [Lachnospiraceae bacterium]|nr:polysaccharide deacetylase family protein [Lachnospiraceae bacterium]
MDYQLRFPNGKLKALTFSYDDGTECDRRLVDLFDRYRLKGTFHLNTGKFGTSNPFEDYILADEVEELYEGHEVSCHSFDHPFFSHLTKQQMLTQLLDDKKALEDLCHYPVRGMSYPFGEFFREMIDVAQAVGLEYSRTVEDTMNFNLPTDFMRWHPTCHHNKAFSLLDDFQSTPEWRGLSLFYIWGHSFEFERENTWDMIEELCKRLGDRQDIWYATNIEIKDYLCAARGLISSADGSMLYNPYAQTVYLDVKGELKTIAAGESLQLK